MNIPRLLDSLLARPALAIAASVISRQPIGRPAVGIEGRENVLNKKTDSSTPIVNPRSAVEK